MARFLNPYDTSNAMTSQVHYLQSGECIQVTDNGHGMYRIACTNTGQMYDNVDQATLNAVLDGTAQLTGVIMTDEEEKQLHDLENDLRKWEHQQRIKVFKKLPSHLRQEIVDEYYLKLTCEEMNNIDTSEFDHNEKLTQLRNKKNQSTDLSTYIGYAGGLTLSSGTGLWYTNNHLHFDMPHQPLKYGAFFEQFSLEELTQAHAEASLEEELS